MAKSSTYKYILTRMTSFFITAFLFLAGIILFSFGIVVDLLINIKFNTQKQEKRYRVREVIGSDHSDVIHKSVFDTIAHIE